MPGTYHQSVKVTTPGLTLSGMGRQTVLKPATKAKDDCGKRGNGICVAGTKSKRLMGVTVSDLTVTGYSRAGVVAVGADGLIVRHVNSVKNGLWGFAEERSEHSTYQENTARNNGDAGLFLANTITAEKGATDTKGTLIAHNHLEATGSASPSGGCAISPSPPTRSPATARASSSSATRTSPRRAR